MTKCVLPLTQSREKNKKQMEGINSSIILQTDPLLPTPSLLYSYMNKNHSFMEWRVSS